jgi:MinD superfamily P-loop ATPase
VIISIASGKGGTGKTTISTNLASAIGQGAQLLDCDVEEPNSHLFMNPELKTKEKIYALIPKVDDEKCTYCGKCADICRFSAISVVGETVLTFPELCHGCGGCMVVCPEKAISETGRELGVVETGNVGSIKFGHGVLRIGEAMSPPLIDAVRKLEKEDLINIIDAPPGTSCPVIAAMKNADFILMVTEPTPFGLHDLTLAVEAVKVLGIPSGLVINRSDIGDDGVLKYAEKENIPVLLEIPFDRRIAEAYSKGKLIIDELPEWKEEFVGLLNSIKKLLKKNKRGEL